MVCNIATEKGTYRILWRARQCIRKIHHQNITQWIDTYLETDGKEQKLLDKGNMQHKDLHENCLHL